MLPRTLEMVFYGWTSWPKLDIQQASGNRRLTEHASELGILGADDEIRTRDPHLGKVMLYQLSYVRTGSADYQDRGLDRDLKPPR
jgi:hypothetical protein